MSQDWGLVGEHLDGNKRQSKGVGTQCDREGEVTGPSRAEAAPAPHNVPAMWHSSADRPCFALFVGFSLAQRHRFAPTVANLSCSCLKKNFVSDFSEQLVTVDEILGNLATQIQSDKISKFNNNRRDIWNGAVHGFKCNSYDPTNTMLVKFKDDSGNTGDGIDAGGPKREFF
ncbi:UNVERIFIED_CONTAM: hypothetical protein FKN15_044599 [Acipenser sinensis]